MAYRVLNFHCNPNLIPEIHCRGDSSLSSRSFVSANFFRDRLYCFMYPNHEEHHQSLMLRAWFLHPEAYLRANHEATTLYLLYQLDIAQKITVK